MLAVAGAFLGANFAAMAVEPLNAFILGVGMPLIGWSHRPTESRRRPVGWFMYPLGVTFGIASIVVGVIRIAVSP